MRPDRIKKEDRNIIRGGPTMKNYQDFRKIRELIIRGLATLSVSKEIDLTSASMATAKKVREALVQAKGAIDQLLGE